MQLPLSLRSEIVRELEGWREFEGDDDRYVMKGDHPYSSNPAESIDQMLQGLAELGIPRPAMRRLEGVRPGLVALLKKTSLDDLDGEVLLDWLCKEARLKFVDDFVSLPAKASSELTEVLADLVSGAVADNVSIPAFAKKVVDGLRTWARRHSVDPNPLMSYEEQFCNHFEGVMWHRAPDAQEALVDRLADHAVTLLRVRWGQAARPVESYSPEKRFTVGARLSHPKFGTGEVTRQLDGKIEIRFEGGVRTLAAKNADG